MDRKVKNTLNGKYSSAVQHLIGTFELKGDKVEKERVSS